MSTRAATRGVASTIQDAKTTGNGDVLAIPDSFRNHTLYIKGAADVSAGAIQPESADSYDYAGTWAPIGGGPVSVGNATEVVINFTGVYKFLRARISTTISGGAAPSVTVKYVGS